MTYEEDFKIVELEKRIKALEDIVYEHIEKPNFKKHCRELERQRQIVNEERT